MIQYVEAEVLGVHYICDNCSKGYLICISLKYSEANKGWIHKCNYCNETMIMDEKYPGIKFNITGEPVFTPVM